MPFSLTFALCESQVFLNIFLFVQPCWIYSEADMLLWPPQPALTHSPSCWPQSLVTISFSDISDKSGKQNLWEKIWNLIPALDLIVLSLCQDDLMFSKSGDSQGSWDKRGLSQSKIDSSDRPMILGNGASGQLKFQFPNSHCSWRQQKRVNSLNNEGRI